MKKSTFSSISCKTGATLLLLLLLLTGVRAQDCYKTMQASPLNISAMTGSGLCATQLCLGSAYNELQLIVDNDLETYAEWNNLLTVGSIQGVSIVSDSVYPAGYVTGFVVSRSGLASLSSLSDLSMSTYLNDTLRETRTGSTLLSLYALGGTENYFLTFVTMQSFNEIRLNTSLLSAGVLNGFRIHSALAFSPDCNIENNSTCLDFINGPGTIVTYNGGVACVACNLQNAGRLTDADKSNYATLSLPVSALAAPTLGVMDLRNVYPAGTRAGFIIEPEGTTILDADVLESISVQTFLFGELKQQFTYTGSSSLLDVNLLGGGGSQKQKIGFTTNTNFNEVRISFNNLATIGLSSIRIYGAYEEPATCTDCRVNLTTAGTGNYQAALVANEIGIPGYIWNGNYGIALLGGLSNPANIINNAAGSYATIDVPLASVAAGSRISVHTNNNATFPAGTYAGFIVEKQSGLLQLGLLSAITVKAYNGNTFVGSETGAALLGAGLLSGGNGRTAVGFYPSNSFDRIVFEIDYGLAGIGAFAGDYRVHNVFVIEDSDNDGTPDCIDQCAGDDNMDTDGDGIPDACDQSGANVISYIELLPPSPSSFYAGDQLTYRITVTNLGTETAQNVTITNSAPPGTLITSWTATSTGGVALPATSGTGNILQTVPSLPQNDTIRYIVNVATPVNYTGADVRNSITVTSTTPDPDPACPGCTTPGLPRIVTADLVVNTNMPFSSFSQQTPQRNMVVTVQEIANTGTTGTITLYLPKASSYSMNFDATAANILLSGSTPTTIDNNDWDFDDSNPNYYIFTSKSGVQIDANTFSRIGLTVNDNTSGLGASAIINVSIGNNSGGERNNLNNNTSRTVTFD